MNFVLWILQVLLALHTVMGAVWKFSHSEQAAPSLHAIPHGVWLSLVVAELLCAVGLLLPAIKKSLGRVAAVAAACIAGEMLYFSAVHLQSGEANHAPMIYWLVVAGLAAFIAIGRSVSPVKT